MKNVDIDDRQYRHPPSFSRHSEIVYKHYKYDNTILFESFTKVFFTLCLIGP